MNPAHDNERGKILIQFMMVIIVTVSQFYDLSCYFTTYLDRHFLC